MTKITTSTEFCQRGQDLCAAYGGAIILSGGNLSPLYWHITSCEECRNARGKGAAMTTEGFTCLIENDTDLGNGILLADLDTCSVPVAVVSTIDEASDVAESDMADRIHRLAQGETPECPESYSLWARGIGGDYRLLRTFSPTNNWDVEVTYSRGQCK